MRCSDGIKVAFRFIVYFNSWGDKTFVTLCRAGILLYKRCVKKCYQFTDKKVSIFLLLIPKITAVIFFVYVLHFTIFSLYLGAFNVLHPILVWQTLICIKSNYLYIC